jgi:hypothetical protein
MISNVAQNVSDTDIFGFLHAYGTDTGAVKCIVTAVTSLIV